MRTLYACFGRTARPKVHLADKVDALVAADQFGSVIYCGDPMRGGLRQICCGVVFSVFGKSDEVEPTKKNPGWDLGNRGSFSSCAFKAL